ncbi:DUF2199 domain-containing protein [Microbulbifer harenosus]|uniref:DUF2199 domain-containing protein n=1 Tax=Microbulbifer harenosus TaxID=2576840 RepID=A0ABY2UGB5_9GAMM|nr:DUF2199 domain-containing protein [Microbulbifer harenosus]TLM76691.1 DUF2199 domain-containing protein [Microbulbifer harenosus]
MSDFKFKCNCCGEIHEGIPSFGADYPITVLQIPESEREERVDLGSDDCVIDEKDFYIRGCIEIPVQGYEEPFVWGAWVSLSEESFLKYVEYFGKEKRSHVGPFFGWLCSDYIVYPEQCLNLKTRVHLRDNGIRPFIELEPTEHLLAVEQNRGISKERLIEIYETTMHGK